MVIFHYCYHLFVCSNCPGFSQWKSVICVLLTSPCHFLSTFLHSRSTNVPYSSFSLFFRKLRFLSMEDIVYKDLNTTKVHASKPSKVRGLGNMFIYTTYAFIIVSIIYTYILECVYVCMCIDIQNLQICIHLNVYFVFI